ncbi:phosphodiesterase [Neogemmobacter tilapiae]|uniref:3',5'-cyclic adenosine monophosphate phosphodiesterase CpdA n=1 Tax=Neogemmobacter tilapiae TaxID=875041 RepID=A0A918TKM5_9RHOB|nr:phosphodiesterase [Gemmobacter tilapiae]GHC53441.1 3',5'-cyclic adenosine monophosphate phosphodiesterase CpdA [Gemmobacter tilapiae]
MKFIVLSDLHLSAPGVPVNGLDTGERLAAAVACINRDHANADFVLIAGDLADRAEPAAYHALRDLLEPLTMPVHLTLGNHDHRDNFLSVWGMALDHPQGRISQAIDHDGYRILLLDSSEPGLVGGRLCEGRWQWLEDRLGEAGDRPVIVVLHHHAAPLSLPVDDIVLEDGTRFAETLNRHPDVRLVLSGHVHLPSAGTWRGLPVVTMAGSHYSVSPHVPGVPGDQRQLEGPAQMAVVLADADGVMVHFHDYLDRHLILAPGLFAHG